jgi:hypothetical protein
MNKQKEYINNIISILFHLEDDFEDFLDEVLEALGHKAKLDKNGNPQFDEDNQIVWEKNEEAEKSLETYFR